MDIIKKWNTLLKKIKSYCNKEKSWSLLVKYLVDVCNYKCYEDMQIEVAEYLKILKSVFFTLKYLETQKNKEIKSICNQKKIYVCYNKEQNLRIILYQKYIIIYIHVNKNVFLS